MSKPTYQEEKNVTPQTLHQVEAIYITSFPQHLMVPFSELKRAEISAHFFFPF
jgi:hypothetical protein